MECKNIKEQFSGYLDGLLSDAEKRKIAAHLDSCRGCREELERLQKVIDLVGELPYLTAPEGLHEKILRMTLKTVPGEDKPLAIPPRLSRWLPLMKGVAAAAVILLFAVVGLEVMDSGAPLPEIKAPAGEAVGSEFRPETKRPGEPDASLALLQEEKRRSEDLQPGENLKRIAGRKARRDKAPGEEGEKARKKQAPGPPAFRAEKDAKDKADRPEVEEAEAEDRVRKPPAPSPVPGGKKKSLAEPDKAQGESSKADRPAPSKRPRKKGAAADGRPESKKKARGQEKGKEPLPARLKKKLEECAKSGAIAREGKPARRGRPEEIPTTLVISSSNPHRDATRIEIALAFAKIESLKARSRRKLGRKKALEPGPAHKRKESLRKAPSEAALDDEAGAEGGAALPPPSGGPSAEKPSAASDALDEDLRKKRKAGKSEEAESEDADDFGPGGPSRRGERRESETLVFFLTEAEYRSLKKRLAELDTRFVEVPSDLLRDFQELRKRLKAASARFGRPRAEGPSEGRVDAGEPVKAAEKESGAGKAETVIRITIRFEPDHLPAPAPAKRESMPEGRAEEKAK